MYNTLLLTAVTRLYRSSLELFVHLDKSSSSRVLWRLSLRRRGVSSSENRERNWKGVRVNHAFGKLNFKEERNEARRENISFFPLKMKK